MGELRYCVVEKVCVQGVCVCDDDDNFQCDFFDFFDGIECDFSFNDCIEGDICKSGQCIVGSMLLLDDGNVCIKDFCVKGVIIYQVLMEG